MLVDGKRRRRTGGQILVVAALAMVAMVAGGALVLEAGNAAAQQRGAQNGADAAANAGAAVLAEKLGGNFRTDAQVYTKVTTVAAQNTLGVPVGYYTDITGKLLTPGGVTTNDAALAAVVGGGLIPSGAQGVRVGGTRSFGTSLGRVIGIASMDASADATAVAGRLTGGRFLPVVFPVNIVACDGSGGLNPGVPEDNWQLSQPGNPPVGQEYIVPMCKTGSGSFMVLDFDGIKNNCAQEALSTNAVRWDNFPLYVASDNGNNCAKPLADAVNSMSGQVIFVPICDDACSTTGGSNAEYHITKVAAFYLDYMVDSNNPNHSACSGNGTTLIPIVGNGSSSCIAGWFIRYVTTGPVGAGPVGNTDAIGVQLIR